MGMGTHMAGTVGDGGHVTVVVQLSIVCIITPMTTTLNDLIIIIIITAYV